MKIQSKFEKDNFSSRRTTGHNLYDPESLLTGAEVAAGFTFDNSHRDWPTEEAYDDAVAGRIGVESIPHVAPRVFSSVVGTGI